MDSYSIIQEQFGALWRVYWNVRDVSPEKAQRLKTEIENTIRMFRKLMAENRELVERNTETERLLVAAIHLSRQEKLA